MNKENLTEEILNEETRRLVGYIMPILESENMAEAKKTSIKKILYKFKNNCVMLINEKSNEKPIKQNQ